MRKLKLFLLDHIWVIISFIIGPVGFFSIYFILYNLTLKDFMYYIFLNIFILTLALLWRFYVTKDIYELFENNSENIDSYTILNPKCKQTEAYQKLFHKIRLLHKNTYNTLTEDKKNQKLMIYQWVHQIKTPLSVIKLLAEKQKQNSDFVQINKSIIQIQYNLDQILNIYKIDAIENEFITEKVYLNQICKQSINDLKSYFISNKIYPKLDISSEIYVYSDAKWLKMVIDQLLSNSVKYSPPNSSVTINSFLENQNIILEIKDNGYGIPTSEQSRIFDLFFVGEKTRQSGESSGIGLYIVKKILFHLGHNLTFYSEEHSGSRFVITFKQQ